MAAGLAQLRPEGRAVATVAFLTGALVVGVGLLGISAGAQFHELSRDPLSVAGAPFYYGALSNFFVLVWWSSAVCCFFASALLARRGRRERSRFLLVAGLGTAWLTLDDFFQFHELIVPVHLGLPEELVHIVYIGGVIAFGYAWRATILGTPFVIVLAAGAFFAASTLVDVVLVALLDRVPLEHLMEDGAKFIGIALWLLYFGRVSAGWVSEVEAPAARPPGGLRGRGELVDAEGPDAALSGRGATERARREPVLPSR
jgi:hypothetical protein